MMPRPVLLADLGEGPSEIGGVRHYVVPAVDRMAPFLMSVVSDSDLWCFVSSSGGLTAGRRDAGGALFPYETDDRLHRAAGLTGPVTAVRVLGAEGSVLWEPFGRCIGTAIRRTIAKSVVGDSVVFEEVDESLGLAFRYRWSTSDRFGFIRRSELLNLTSQTQRVRLIDGLVNILPPGLEPDQVRSRSNLTNAYKRSELVDRDPALVLHTLEALVVDRASPAEALRATVSWSLGLDTGAVTVDERALDAFRSDTAFVPEGLVTGRPGAHLIAADLELDPDEVRSWHLVADVTRDHVEVAALRRDLPAGSVSAADLEESVRHDSAALTAKVAMADGLQRTGDERATEHHFANALFNTLRGGIFLTGYRISTADFRRFVASRNRPAADRHRELFEAWPPEQDRSQLLDRAAMTGDPDLARLAGEYLPIAFSRRHGDPSRPWNEFSIRLKDDAGAPILNYEGNWRDIFQNWEALCMSFPEYLPSVISLFVNASTPDGFNPYRVTRDGFEWEVPDPDDPWSNIGYWGDHQIVYLLRLLEEADRFLPGVVADLLLEPVFTYADVPYRIVPYPEILTDPRSTIRYDAPAAARSHDRTEQIGADGRLLPDPGGGPYRANLLEKLLVPALSKLSNYVPGGGIWMNTQRPEWNDANNALVGYGLSMVTLYQLRRYLRWVADAGAGLERETVPISREIADWLAAIANGLTRHQDLVGAPIADERRKTVMDELGEAFSDYRSRVYSTGLTAKVEMPVEAVVDLCRTGLLHLDDTIRRNRRLDGLFHSYNLVAFSEDGSGAGIGHLPEMLEGQVAALGSGFLAPAECADIIDTLFASDLHRTDQDSFLLYPDRRPSPFVEKNEVPDVLVEENRLLVALLAAGDRSVIQVDVDGTYRFHADFRSAEDLASALDRLATTESWKALVEADRDAVLDAYEAVFNHHAFTGRSGTMYGYEGLGSIYWHMVSKLLVAAQECVHSAVDSGADPGVVDRLRRSYFGIRGGLGFNKTAAEYGAVPTDPYGHTPAHAGAQQPGMTGQVKEELLTRPAEVGVRVIDGELRFDPTLVRRREFLAAPAMWTHPGIEGIPETVELGAGSLGLTVCQVPTIVSLTDGDGRVLVSRADGTTESIERLGIGDEASREIFARSESVVGVEVWFPRSLVDLD